MEPPRWAGEDGSSSRPMLQRKEREEGGSAIDSRVRGKGGPRRWSPPARDARARARPAQALGETGSDENIETLKGENLRHARWWGRRARGDAREPSGRVTIVRSERCSDQRRASRGLRRASPRAQGRRRPGETARGIGDFPVRTHRRLFLRPAWLNQVRTRQVPAIPCQSFLKCALAMTLL